MAIIAELFQLSRITFWTPVSSDVQRVIRLAVLDAGITTIPTAAFEDHISAQCYFASIADMPRWKVRPRCAVSRGCREIRRSVFVAFGMIPSILARLSVQRFRIVCTVRAIAG